MELALALADSRRGLCAPNPSVGAVVVSPDGCILAKGEHWECGQPHAEVVALRKCGDAAKGATLFVTLEPCCHTGRTPPCTKAIIDAGISQVYFGFKDPNPRVSGGGQDSLHRHGINCEMFSLDSINLFYRSYAHWVKTGLPFVRAKIAITLDGFIANVDGSPFEITGPEAKRYTFEGRRSADAILTTANTVLADNPALNIRHHGCKPQSRPVYVIDSRLRCSADINLLSTASELIFICAESVESSRVDFLVNSGVRCEKVSSSQGLIDIGIMLSLLGRDGVHELWVESGGEFFESLLMGGFLNEALIYLGAKLAIQGKKAFFREDEWPCIYDQVSWSDLGGDVLLKLSF